MAALPRRLTALVVALWGATGVMSSVRKALAEIFDDLMLAIVAP